MRKIHPSQENPVDNLIIDFCDFLCPSFFSYNLTPNHITTLSLIFGIISVIALYKGYVYVFAVTYFISYFFDCMDGYYARKYKLTSKFGDYYDHIKDASVSIALLCVVYYRYKKCSMKNIGIVLGVLGVFLLLTCMHLGCQEKIYNTNESESLSFTKMLCVSEEHIGWTRYFGTGTFTLIFIGMIIYIEKYQDVCTL